MRYGLADGAPPRHLTSVNGHNDIILGAMTEDEKSQFLDATLPSGFKQMLSSFSQLAPEKRHQIVDNAIKNLQKARDTSSGGLQQTNGANTNAPVLSEALQKQVAVIGLKSVYSDSSAETKAELAPLLEEVQKNMESGRGFRGGGGNGGN